MGTPAPDAVKRLVDHFDQNRKACPARSYGGVATRSRRVFLSPDHKEEQLCKVKTLHEREFLQRQIAAADKAIDALVYELYGLTEEEVGIVEGAAK
jgi:hypothetical protein